MGADYILWDEPHWAGQGGWYFLEENEWTCRCEACRDSFVKAFGYEMPMEWNKDIENFRKDVMIDFLDELSKYALELGLRNIVCFFPNRKQLAGRLGIPMNALRIRALRIRERLEACVKRLADSAIPGEEMGETP